MKPASKSTLTPARARLVELMQFLGHGRFENLVVRRGQPVFDPPPIMIRDLKLGAENGPRPEASLDDFALKGRVRELFEHFDSVGSVTIRRLVVMHGLPVRLELEAAAS